MLVKINKYCDGELHGNFRNAVNWIVVLICLKNVTLIFFL